MNWHRYNIQSAQTPLSFISMSQKNAGETLDKSLDTGLPLIILVELIPEALEMIYQKALELRASQLDSLAKDSVIVRKPSYKNFYSELITTELFAITRYKADQDLQVTQRH